MSHKVSTKQIEYDPIPEGIYPAICYASIDLGLQYSEKFKTLSAKTMFIWEICDDDLREDFGRGKLERRVINKKYTISFSERSNLYKDLRPWIGREVSEDEIDLWDFVGKPCTLTIIRQEGGDGKIYSRISAIAPLMKGLNVGKPENTVILYDIDESSEETFNLIPEWIQKKIKQAKNPDNKQANSVSVNVDLETGEVLEKAEDAPQGKTEPEAKEEPKPEPQKKPKAEPESKPEPKRESTPQNDFEPVSDKVDTLADDVF